jgi:hypothetical protein
MNTVSDGTARRAAKKAGLVAKRSRRRANTVDNRGGFMLVDPMRNIVIAGARFELTAQQVVDIIKASNQTVKSRIVATA